MSCFAAPATMRLGRACRIVLLSGLVASCTRNAGIEIDLTVPGVPSGTPTTFAYVQFERPPLDFDSQWPDGSDVAGTALTSQAQHLRFSVLTESFDAPLRIKVRFCETERCRGNPAVPELWFELERPFYRAERTRWSHVIRQIPAMDGVSCGEAAIVDRCAVQGCVSVSSEAEGLSFCRLDGTHFCEAPLGGVGPDGGPVRDACGPASDAAARDAGDAGDAARGGDR